MIEIQESKSLGVLQKILLVIATLTLVITLLFLRVGINNSTPLNQLVNNSLEPNKAFANGKPTIIEFYADWCEACKEMAPIMLKVEESYDNQINIAMLNVDNPRWNELIETYNVNGIPQLNFFDKNSNPIGHSIGLQKEEQIIKYFNQLTRGEKINKITNKIGQTSVISEYSKDYYLDDKQKLISPRSHG